MFFMVTETVGWKDIKEAMSVFKGWQGVAILALTLLIALTGNWKWREILKAEGVEVPYKKLFQSFIAGFAIMFLAPALLWGGELFRGYILKNRCGVPWRKGMASVIIDRILEWTVNLIVILLGSLLFLSVIKNPPFNLLGIFAAVFFLFLSAISFFYVKCIKKESVIGFLTGRSHQLFETEKEIFNFFRLKSLAMWKVIAISLLRAFFMYGRVGLIILFLGRILDGTSILSVLGFNYLAVMIPIPTALGSHEAIQLFAFRSLGMNASMATAFTMIVRGAELMLALFGVLVLFRLGTVITKDALFKKIDNISEDNQ